MKAGVKTGEDTAMERPGKGPLMPSMLPPLFLVTDRSLFADRDLTGPVEEAMRGGVRLIQLREKDLGARALLEIARRLREITERYGGRIIINERVDVALLSRADGVHLGQGSFAPGDVRPVLTEGMVIGVSAHGLEEALKAEEEGADYITLGPVFKTPSKERYGSPLGVEAFKKVKERVRIPVYAIGGIKRGNINDVLGAGADGAAVISAILGAKDIRESAKELTECIEACRKP